MNPKGTRQIIVGERTFRYAATEQHNRELSLLVEREGGGQRLAARFDVFLLHGQELRWDRYISKRYVRTAIVEALARGWQPDQRGKPFVLGAADLFGEHRAPAWTSREGLARDLLDAVIASPERDEPRLVLADWLMESDSPRGRFIREQCSGEPARELLWRYFRRWSAPAWQVARRWGFARGFIDSVELERIPEPEPWQTLHRLEPLRKIELRSGREGIDALGWLLKPSHRELTLHGALDDADAATIALCPAARSLRRIVLRGHQLSERGIAALARELPLLDEIQLDHVCIGPTALEAVRARAR